ncbi:MAG: aldose 1-epimerase [Acetobacteraceae bacterium]
MLTMRSGESSLVLAPEIGGSIAGWMRGRVPVLRRPLPDAILAANPRGLACFPLVPFSNRIARGRFRWGGVGHTLDRNFGDHPHAIHGAGWQSAWQVDAVSPGFARLTLHHDPHGEAVRHWPFAFAAEQVMTLTGDSLHVAMALRNLHAAPAPAGLGLHPYFPLRHRPGDAAPMLRFAARTVWHNGADALPSDEVPVPAEWDHAGGRAIGTAMLDNCFCGWDGTAEIAWPSGLRLTIEATGAFRHLIVYTPPGRDFFCVEPVSHMNDAINRMEQVPGHGLRTLAPGETLEGAVTFCCATAG